MTDIEALDSYKHLGPDQILDAVESAGFRCDGHVSALNSYENRVYQIGIEESKPVIAKFYRPQRWSDESILEEHAYTLELAEQEIPAISPFKDENGQSLFHPGAYRFAIYARVGGRAPELDDPEHLMQLGRCIARIHNTGATRAFSHRPTLDIESFAMQPRKFILENNFIPADLLEAYETLSSYVIEAIETCFSNAGDCRQLRLHGDFHLGNILWYDDAPFIVDFDDARTGPAVQDLWMLLSGDRAYMTARLHDLLEGYCEFRDFDARELHLIEGLRTLRIMHYAGWLAKRWDDPAFPQAFPWFNSQRYWEEHILSLREQQALMQEAPLQWQRI